MTPQQQHLEQQQAARQAEQSLRAEKLKRLRTAIAIETDSNRTFQLEHQIKAEETILAELAQALTAIQQSIEALQSGRSESPLPTDHAPSGGQMTQHNDGNARGWQTTVTGGTAYIGEIHIHGKES